MIHRPGRLPSYLPSNGFSEKKRLREFGELSVGMGVGGLNDDVRGQNHTWLLAHHHESHLCVIFEQYFPYVYSSKLSDDYRLWSSDLYVNTDART